MAEGGGYSQHLSQTEERDNQVGNLGPHHFSHISSHSSQGSHPHPRAVVHGSPVRGSGNNMLGASPSRLTPSHRQHLSGEALQQQGTGAGSSSSTSWSNIPLAVDSGTSLDDEGKEGCTHDWCIVVLLRWPCELFVHTLLLFVWW